MEDFSSAGIDSFFVPQSKNTNNEKDFIRIDNSPYRDYFLQEKQRW
jgi:hypothetical protein